MIVSYRHGYIFIKTRKTAGTSVEIALGKHRGERDIVAAIAKEPTAEQLAAIDDPDTQAALARGERPSHLGPAINYALGFLGPQNHLWPDAELRGMKEPPSRPEKFTPHMPARTVRDRLPKGDWGRLYKVCVERNPWDKVLSAYWYLRRKETPGRDDLANFVLSGEAAHFSDWNRYTDGKGTVLMDHIMRYESLDREMEAFCSRVGMPPLDLPKAKGWTRKDRSHYRDVFTAEERDRIARDFANEIRLLDYDF